MVSGIANGHSFDVKLTNLIASGFFILDILDLGNTDSGLQMIVPFMQH